MVILLHLLKWQHQPECRGEGWRSSLREHRGHVNDDLKDSPSLVPYLQQIFAKCYINAYEQVADEIGLPLERFPLDCPYTIEQVLDSNYYLPD